MDTDFQTIDACKHSCSHWPVAGQVRSRSVIDGPDGRAYTRRELKIAPVQQEINPV